MPKEQLRVSLETVQKLRDLVERSLPHGRTEASRNAVQFFMQQRKLQLPSKLVTEYNADTLWEDGIDRSLARYLHGLLFLRDWPESILLDETGETARSAVAVVLDWYRKFPNRGSCSHSMAFHDETTAQRLITLIAIYKASHTFIKDTHLSLMKELMLVTSDLLLDDDFHATGNNHGMFQDIALRSYSALGDLSDPDISIKMSTSIDRLNDYFSSSFTIEGVHRENSPTYHLMITKHLAEHAEFLRLLNSDHGEDALVKLLEDAAEYATHAILPTGVFLPLSDTQQTPISAPHHNVFKSPQFQYAASAGKNGTVPSKKYLSLPKSGYFYARNKWGSTKATFVSFVAAYNDNYHKHSDDLSLFVWHKGQELLSEAGPFGYNYQLPLTRYGFSQYAHNNIVVNGSSVPRTDTKSSSVWMQAMVEGSDGMMVTAGTGRLKDTYHERQVSVASDFQKIEVEDRLQSVNHNKYECLWNLGKNVNVVTHGDGFELFYGKTKVADAYVESSEPVQITVHRGQMKPKPLGWHFPKFGESQATNTVLVTLSGSDASIKTTFNFEKYSFNNNQSELVRKSEKSSTSPQVLFNLEKKTINNHRLLVVFTKGQSSCDSFESLRDIDANKLYIHDTFGEQGCYYWMQHGRETVFDSVQQLITSTMKALGIHDSAHVAMFGFDSGGTAAILHGAGVSAGVVFVGSSQFAVGSFLEKSHPSVLQYMSRGETRSHAVMLDERFVNKLNSFEAIPRIHQISGIVDSQYPHQSTLLKDYIASRDVPFEFININSDDKVELEKHYNDLLPKVANDFSNSRFDVLRQYDVTVNCLDSSLLISINADPGRYFSFKLYRSNVLVNTTAYSNKSSFSWNSLKSGRYRVRIYERSAYERMIPFSTSWISVD